MVQNIQTRPAAQHDVEAFVALAAQYCAEFHPEQSFDRNNTLYTFSGSPRADPAIFVLESVGDEPRVVGFVTASVRRAPFSVGVIAVQDHLFILPEFRNGDAEALLALALQQWSAAFSPHAVETKLYVTSSEGGLLELDHLRSVGFQVGGVELKLCGKPLALSAPTAQ